MLATYLTVVLGMMLITGITVSVILHQQQKSMAQEELHRQATTLATQYTAIVDAADKERFDERCRFFASYGDRLVQLVVPEERRVISYATQAFWSPVKEHPYTEEELTAFLAVAEGFQSPQSLYEDYLTFPVIAAARQTTARNGQGALVLVAANATPIDQASRTIRMLCLLITLVAALISIVLVYCTTTQLTRPFVELKDIVQRYGKGDYNIRIPMTNVQETTTLAVSFNAMADQLNDLENSRRSFVANVSHELRSPLTSMKGFLEAMSDGTIPQEEHEKYLNIVLSETRRMVLMVNDLLDLARIESGKTALKLEVFDINELIRRTLITFEARIYEKHMDMEVKLAQDQFYVEADNAQISQVLRNLIDNALKYSPDRRKIRIATYALRKQIYVSIQDNGYGIPQEDVPHVFDRFYKVEKAHTPTKQSGTGLGLSIVKRIIDQHGQTITLKSAKGKGSTFTFTLKRVEPPKRVTDGGKKYGQNG